MSNNEQKFLGFSHENNKEMTKIVRNLEQINMNLMQISDNLECLKYQNQADFLENEEEK